MEYCPQIDAQIHVSLCIAYHFNKFWHLPRFFQCQPSWFDKKRKRKELFHAVVPEEQIILAKLSRTRRTATVLYECMCVRELWWKKIYILHKNRLSKIREERTCWYRLCQKQHILYAAGRIKLGKNMLSVGYCGSHWHARNDHPWRWKHWGNYSFHHYLNTILEGWWFNGTKIILNE